MGNEPDRDGLLEAVAALERAKMDGDATRVGKYLAEDAQQLWDRHEAVVGRDAIVAAYAEIFEWADYSDWTGENVVVDVYEDRAYVLGEFEELIRPYDGSSPIMVLGRAIQFWRRDAGGTWLLAYGITGRRAEEEEVTGSRSR
jgi:ketosteroid isomerase-like protein